MKAILPFYRFAFYRSCAPRRDPVRRVFGGSKNVFYLLCCKKLKKSKENSVKRKSCRRQGILTRICSRTLPQWPRRARAFCREPACAFLPGTRRAKGRRSPPGKDVNQMPDLFHFSPEMLLYFQTLPAETRRSVLQSNAKLNCLEDLKEYAERLCGQKPLQ